MCWGNGQFLLGQQQVLQYSQLRRSSQVFGQAAPRLLRQISSGKGKEEDEDPPHGEIGSVVSAGNTPSSAADGPAFSLEDDDETAARRRSACTPPPPAPRRRLSDYEVQHVVHGIYKHCNLFEDCFPCRIAASRSASKPSPGSINIGYDVGVSTSAKLRHRSFPTSAKLRHPYILM